MQRDLSTLIFSFMFDDYGVHVQYMGVLSILLLLLLVYLQQPVDYSNSVTIYIRSVYVYTDIMYYCL